ncbi:MAG: recombination protein RecR [Neisseriaceae bacterium]|nr:recombination protein RecR [Neisseriaceae bacterium]
MTKKNDALAELIAALKTLPSVGVKSAQRMAYHLLQHDREGAGRIVTTLQNALKQIIHCRLCNTLCEHEICHLCSDEKRDHSRLMIVHMPSDVISMESANCHDGLYFVLMGYIDPTQNRDIHSTGLEKLLDRIETGEITEIIIATNFTAEGNATAHILYEALKNYPCKISRLSQGMPLGSELEYIDSGTLAQAVYERKCLKN